MNKTTKTACQQEYDFALIVDGVEALTTEVENALFEAGCDDATLSIQYGRLYMEFSREAESFEQAIFSAIQDVRKADLNAQVLRVDDCNLVTAAEIARRIGRSRQLVHQYMNGDRGPGNFPPPECHMIESSPLWAWCEVSFWLAENDIIRPETNWDAEVVAAINNWLEHNRQNERHPALIKTIQEQLQERA